MDATPPREPDVALAAIGTLLVVCLLAAAGPWLLRPDAAGPGRQAPLRVVWVVPAPPTILSPLPLPPPASPSPAPAPPIAIAASPPRMPGVQASARPPALLAPREAPTAAVPGPTSPGLPDLAGPDAGDLTRQAHRWATQAAPIGDFAPDPLQRRYPPPQPAERFRMRPPPSPAAVLERIGTLLAGADYERDPCPRIRRNLADLATGRDPALLAEELRRQRALCD